MKNGKKNQDNENQRNEDDKRCKLGSIKFKILMDMQPTHILARGLQRLSQVKRFI